MRRRSGYNAPTPQPIPHALAVSLTRALPGAQARPTLSLDAPAGGLGRLYGALALSTALHASLVVIGFQIPAPNLPQLAAPLEVVLVNSRTRARPEKADAHAQVNLDGGGNTERDVRAKTNLPALEEDASEEVTLAAERVRQLEADAQRLIAQLSAEGAISQRTTLARPQPDAAADPKLVQLPEEKLRLAHLQAQIDREWQAYQRMPKRRFVGSRVASLPYAQYVDEWRQKIERVGTAHFPDQAKRQGLVGTVLVTVAIRADGSVEKVELDHSSGNKVLDAAVEHIVRLASPFRPFPQDIRKETDILHITRNWSFTRTDLLITGK